MRPLRNGMSTKDKGFESMIECVSHLLSNESIIWVI